jgi:uncharacterized damage-inducible protein DinB
MKSYFLDLLRYNLWANQRILGVVSQNNIEDDDVMRLMSHLVSAEIIWLHRVEGLPTSPFPPWEVYKLRELESMVDESNVRWVKFLKNYKVDTLEEVIHYKNSHKKTFENRLKDIITHTINHSTHHRSQISLRLRQLNIDPPPLDFIIFKRLGIS